MSSQEAPWSFHRVSGQQNINCKTLAQTREPTALLRRRNQHGFHAMLETVHARLPSNQERPKLARVQMPPGSRFRVVVTGQLPLTVRALEFRSPGMIDVDSYLLRGRVPIHLGNRPRQRQTKNRLIKVCVLHLRVPPAQFLPNPRQTRNGLLDTPASQAVEILGNHENDWRFDGQNSHSMSRETSRALENSSVTSLADRRVHPLHGET